MAAKHQVVSALALVLLALAGVRSAAALSAPPGLQGVWEDEREALEALALYPEDVRHAVLEASTRPGVLSRIESIRGWSNRDFGALLSDLPREEQAQLWELVRYPGLVAELVAGGRKSTGDLERIAAGYPEEVREAAVDSAREHFDLLVEIDRLHREADEAFEELIADEAPEARAAFRELLARPEVLSILVDRMRMTALLGEAYERDPEGVEAAFAELHLDVARKNAESLREWEQALEENPELLDELEASGQVFAEESGYDPDAPRPATAVNFYFYPYPYPYWFGFPFWVDVGFWYPVWHAHWFWYPRPCWAHTGFYYGPNHALVVFGLPSFHYLHWYFSWHRHPHRYRHLSRSVAHHFEADHRRQAGRELARRSHRPLRESAGRELRPSQRRVGETPFVSRADRRSPGGRPALAGRGDAADRVAEARGPARARGPRPPGAARDRGRAASRGSALRAAEPRRVGRPLTRERTPQVRAAKADRAQASPARAGPRPPRVTEARPEARHLARLTPRPPRVTEARPAQPTARPPRVARARPVERPVARVAPERSRGQVGPSAHSSAPWGGRPSTGRLGFAGGHGRFGPGRGRR